MDFNSVIIGIIGIVLGLAMIRYSYYLNHQVFFLDFIERKFGSGTGTLAYRFIGLSLCLIGMLVMFGIVNVTKSSFGNPPGSTPNDTNTTTPTTPAKDSRIAN